MLERSAVRYGLYRQLQGLEQRLSEASEVVATFNLPTE